MKYLSLFSGIGGFEKGIEDAYELLHRHEEPRQAEVVQGDEHHPASQYVQRTPTCIGFSEIDKYATAIYQKHYPEHKNYGDITQINPSDLPDFELLVGGFPCQAFSIAGKRGGFDDTRGTLFFEIARIAREKQPRLLLLENVKGLLSHDEGRTFRTIIDTLDELGYDVQWQVINSKNHGVPQNRERIFIVGHLRGTRRPEVFPIATDDGEDTQSDKGRSTELFPTIRATHYKSGDNQPLIKQLNQPTHSNDRVYASDGISPTLNTMQGGNRQPFVAQEEMKIRRLTPTECERLQGFPDGWTRYGRDENKALRDKRGYYTKETIWNYPILKYIKRTVRHDEPLVQVSDTQRYKTLGNAVTTNVIRDIVRNMI